MEDNEILQVTRRIVTHTELSHEFVKYESSDLDVNEFDIVYDQRWMCNGYG